MKRLAIIAACAGVTTVLSSGCIHLDRPGKAQTESGVPVLQTYARLNAENAGTVRDNWVESFSDPVLNALVIESLKANYDLRAAAARHAQAVAFAKRAGANFWPNANLKAGGDAGGRSTGKSTGDVHLIGVVNWEVDIWGRIRYLTESAHADALAAEADYEFARQSIAAEVAETYYLAVANRLRLLNSQNLLKIQDEIDRIVQAKVREGQTTQLESNLSKADLAAFKADVEDRRAAYEEALRALEVLLGRYPSADVAGAPELPPVPGTVPAGLPAQLLERRPDIIAAEQNLASAFYFTKARRLELLPRIVLTGDGGYESTQLKNLFDHHSAFFSLGGNLIQPLFDAGARFANIEGAKAAQEEAVARYASTVLRAFEEVQNGLANEIYFRERAAQLAASASNMDNALPLADTRYKAGEINLLNFKQVQTQAYDTKDQAIAAHFAQIQQRIRLYRALGGSMVSDNARIAPIPTTLPTTVSTTRPTPN